MLLTPFGFTFPLFKNLEPRNDNKTASLHTSDYGNYIRTYSVSYVWSAWLEPNEAKSMEYYTYNLFRKVSQKQWYIKRMDK